MQDENMIPVNDLCLRHSIELQFIESLQYYGLIELTTMEEQVFVPMSQLPELEKMIHLHYDLEINLEGMDVIRHLLKRLERSQEEIRRLEERLKFFGGNQA